MVLFLHVGLFKSIFLYKTVEKYSFVVSTKNTRIASEPLVGLYHLNTVNHISLFLLTAGKLRAKFVVHL